MQEDIPPSATRLLTCMFQMIKMLCVDGGIAQGRDIGDVLINAWKSWLAKEVERYDSRHTGEEDGGNDSPETEVIVLSASFLGGEVISCESISQPEFTRTMKLTKRVCSLVQAATTSKEKLGHDSDVSIAEEEDKMRNLKQRGDEAMRELVLAVHEGQRGVPSMVKHVCLGVSKSFYYAAHCSNKEIDDHVDMVLFQPVH